MRVFYEGDADLERLRNREVGIIGYGIQGRAQALNLRDSGIKVHVGNRRDDYVSTIVADGFEPLAIGEVASVADILLLLIPDQAHAEVYATQIQPRLRQGGALAVAHGYSLRFGLIKPRDDMDVMLLAPRMPGRQIREYYQRGSGVPAFVDVFQDGTGNAWGTVLALAKAMGFTRPGVFHVTVREETELDLFVEQFLVPTILKAIHLSFDELVAAGYPAVPALMELYASGELGEVLLMAAEAGLYGTFQRNASPTCQFGIATSYPQALDTHPRQLIADVIHRIQSGAFSTALGREGAAGYPETRALWQKQEESVLGQTEGTLRQILREQSASGHGGR